MMCNKIPGCIWGEDVKACLDLTTCDAVVDTPNLCRNGYRIITGSIGICTFGLGNTGSCHQECCEDACKDLKKKVCKKTDYCGWRKGKCLIAAVEPAARPAGEEVTDPCDTKVYNGSKK